MHNINSDALGINNVVTSCAPKFIPVNYRIKVYGEIKMVAVLDIYTSTYDRIKMKGDPDDVPVIEIAKDYLCFEWENINYVYIIAGLVASNANIEIYDENDQLVFRSALDLDKLDEHGIDHYEDHDCIEEDVNGVPEYQRAVVIGEASKYGLVVDWLVPITAPFDKLNFYFEYGTAFGDNLINHIYYCDNTYSIKHSEISMDNLLFRIAKV